MNISNYYRKIKYIIVKLYLIFRLIQKCYALCYLLNYVREIDGLHIILSMLRILYSVWKIKRFIDFRQIYKCNYAYNAALFNKRPNSKNNVQKLFTFNRKLFFDIEQPMCLLSFLSIEEVIFHRLRNS